MAFLTVACSHNDKKSEQKTGIPTENPSTQISTEVRTFKSEQNMFGFDVYVNGKKTIHQPVIPGMVGNRGFATEEKAKKTGELMAAKIRQNIMPPTVSPQELDSLQVLN